MRKVWLISSLLLLLSLVIIRTDAGPRKQNDDDADVDVDDDYDDFADGLSETCRNISYATYVSTGEYRSSNYPGSYPPNEDCYYTIYGQSGEGFNGIYVRFEHYDIASSEDCEEDYLKISTFPASTNAWDKKESCGLKQPFTIIVEQGNGLKLHFKTNGSGSARGWLLKYKPICHEKYFGKWCKRCNCKNDRVCDPDTGACPPRECAPFFKGFNCQTRFCPGPLFGEKCDKLCHCKENATCDLFNATCPGGKCDDGWTSISSYGANCLKPLALSILPSSQVAKDSSFTVKCSADAIDIPKSITQVLELTLQGPKNSDGSDNELAFLSYKIYTLSKTTNPRAQWKTMKQGNNSEFTFPTKTEMDSVNSTNFRDILKITLLVKKASSQDSGLYSCKVMFLKPDGSEGSDKREQLANIIEAGIACTNSDNACPVTHIAYTGYCDEDIQRCICNDGYARKEDRCDAAGLKCSRVNNECPSRNESRAYTGECNKMNRCTCSYGYALLDDGCGVPGMPCGKARNAKLCPKDDAAYTGYCGDSNRCTCNEGFVAIGENCTVPGHKCGKDWNSCPANEKYTGDCGENSRCTCAEGFNAFYDRCDVSGLPCSSDENANGATCPINKAAYTGNCDERNNRCTCKDGYVVKYKGCEVDRLPDQAMARDEPDSFMVEGIALWIVIGLVQGTFCLGVYVYVKRESNEYNNKIEAASTGSQEPEKM